MAGADATVYVRLLFTYCMQKPDIDHSICARATFSRLAVTKAKAILLTSYFFWLAFFF